MVKKKRAALNDIVVQCEGRGKICTLRARPFLIRCCKSVLCMSVAGYLLLASLALFLGIARSVTFFSECKNTRLMSEIREMRDFVSSQEEYITRLFSDDDCRRSMYGAVAVSDEVRQVGVGGPATDDDIESVFATRHEIELRRLAERVDKLLRQYDFHDYSLTDFSGYLKDKKYRMDHVPSIAPINGWLLSGFGVRTHPIFHEARMHEGVDIANFEGTPIRASAAGVAKTGRSETYGNYVFLDHGNEFTTIYAHMRATGVIDGRYVKRGEIIGYVGSTGLSTGPHLHYEVRKYRHPIDPETYILPNDFIVD